MTPHPAAATRPPSPPYRRRALRRGTATVEFSLAAPIVFMLFLAMIEFTRFHVVRHSIDQAIYMGARTGIVPGATAAEIDQIVRDRLTAAGVRGYTLTITPNVITNTTPAVTVRVSAPYQQNSWTLPKFFSGMNVAAEITLDHENVAFN
jgi:Flp pilus assembly protein TadG